MRDLVLIFKKQGQFRSTVSELKFIKIEVNCLAKNIQHSSQLPMRDVMEAISRCSARYTFMNVMLMHLMHLI